MLDDECIMAARRQPFLTGSADTVVLRAGSGAKAIETMRGLA